MDLGAYNSHRTEPMILREGTLCRRGRFKDQCAESGEAHERDRCCCGCMDRGNRLHARRLPQTLGPASSRPFSLNVPEVAGRGGYKEPEAGTRKMVRVVVCRLPARLFKG